MKGRFSRNWNIWLSNRIDNVNNVRGVFVIPIARSLMVPQSIEFLLETYRNGTVSRGKNLSPFLFGMAWFDPKQPDSLLYAKDFSTAEEMRSYDFSEMVDAIDELSFVLDVNLSYQEIQYYPDFGLGLTEPLVVARRIPARRGISFEVEERGVAVELLSGDKISDPLVLLAIRYYGVGMRLLALEDSEYGLFEAAFMQFYLVLELLLKANNLKDAKKKMAERGYDEGESSIIEHVYKARNNFFGHGGKNAEVDGVTQDFQVLKQVLVARWAARRAISHEAGVSFYFREMHISDSLVGGACFGGTKAELESNFSLKDLIS